MKGSKKGRKTTIPEDPKHQKKITRKDINFLEDEQKVNIIDSEKFIKICDNDAKFLEDFYLMDYSLFYVKLKFDSETIKNFENFKNSKDLIQYSKYIYKREDKEYEYNIFCIIDYFQVFDLSKNLENKYKCIGYNNNNDIPDISCVPPDQYSARFINFIKNCFNKTK